SLWSAAADLPGRTANQEALAAWWAAHDPPLPVAQRLGYLRRSEQLLDELVQGDGPPSRLASLARVAMELGERQKAVGALAHLSAILQQGGDIRLDEPFLSPHPATDAIPPGDTPALWLEAATLEAQSRLESYSSFFTGSSELPRLRRLRQWGWPSAAMMRKLALLEGRFPQLASTEAPSAAAPARPEEPSVRPWFDLLELDRPLRCLDGGAMGLEAKPEPWVRWAEEGCAEVIGFEPLEEECDRLNRQVAHLGGAVRFLPLALGDGEEHTLHITNAPMTSSLYAPARATVDLFPALGEYMQVEKRQVLRTHRLDGLEGMRPVDFLKLDVQGAELMVLQAAQATLADITVVQCEVEFVELYEGQPLMADVDAFLRSQGFCLLKFAPLKGRPFKPLRIEAHPLSPISQILWTDAIYVKDFRQRAVWSEHQLKAAAFLLHELYNASDLVSLLLSELDARHGTDWQSLYLASVLLSDPALVAG
ncbi:MAG: FkbM family methyltransferase, partial [Cyanobacteriota bacterium]